MFEMLGKLWATLTRILSGIDYYAAAFEETGKVAHQAAEKFREETLADMDKDRKAIEQS